MPKTRIIVNDLTSGFNLPEGNQAVYIPGKVTSGNNGVAAKLYQGRGSLKSAAAENNFDTDCLSYKLAVYLQDTLGLPIVYEGLESTATSVPEESWGALAANIDKLPVRFLTTGQFFDKTIDTNMIACAETRKDCIALVNVDESKIFESGSLGNNNLICTLLVTEPENFDATNYYKKAPTTYSKIEVASAEGPVPTFIPGVYYEKEGNDYVVINAQPGDWGTITAEEGHYYINYYKQDPIVWIQPVAQEAWAENTFYKGLKYYTGSYDVDVLKDIFQTAASDKAAGFTPTFKTKVPALCTYGATLQDIPAAFGFLFAYARQIQTLPEWISTAGAQLGGIPELYVPNLLFSDADSERLQCRGTDPDNLNDHEAGCSINPILEEYPFGYVIWGSRTLRYNAANELKATSFLNVRNLVVTLAKVMRSAARRFTFSQNSDILWFNFKSAIEPTLEDMKNNSGIAGYRFDQEPTTQKARLKAKLTIIPIEPVEDFDLEINLTDVLTVTEV